MIVHGVITEPVIEAIWNRLPHRPSVWHSVEGKDYETFKKYLLQSALGIELSFGFVRVERFLYGNSALVHLVVWNRKALRAHEELLEAASRLKNILRIHAIMVCIPSTNRVLKKLVKELGFWNKAVVPRNYVVGTEEIDGELWVLDI